MMPIQGRESEPFVEQGARDIASTDYRLPQKGGWTRGVWGLYPSGTRRFGVRLESIAGALSFGPTFKGKAQVIA